MYIKYNDRKYSCKCIINNNSIVYKDLPENFSENITGEIALYADDNFELRKDNTNNYLRQIFKDGVLTLTNLPEQEFTEEIIPISNNYDQLRADIDFLALMTGVDL